MRILKKDIILVVDKIPLMYILLIFEKNNLLFNFPRKDEISTLR